MFNIGIGELILILLIAFIVVGPSDLPKIARALAKAVKQIKGVTREVMDAVSLDKEIEEVKKVKADVEQTVRQANPVTQVKKEFSDIRQAVETTGKSVKEELSEIGK